MSWEEVCHWIAQGAVNISSGLTTIEAGSPVHKAMVAFCEYANTEALQFHPCRVVEKKALDAVQKFGRKPDAT